ncbi:c-type cytochrome biogenesis protein CcmI [Chelatococcus sp. SYSU_G07232]|uniref:C-type cytochrome biogenesis protein CcmI n=1 Tax=Chelatococcus albus TaxID=3047466 RepID=A0ABT7AI38_9HYPH|nr:c-type cytochrome biogenesis protein CcmI [Chelatococcus sp. SYSU_G07232]MDJ1159047.1 c-type cytochrome biogenesis protein CcmI [Chelatococcus sp. SYSU_G07232]
MAIWVIFALMTGAAVLAVLWPLSRQRTAAADDGTGDDAAFYRQQIAEIERDAARGALTAAEAEAAKAEAGRRLLRAAAAAEHAAADQEGEPALRRRRAASAVTLSTIPLVALALYGALGSPQLPSVPHAERLAGDPRGLDLAAAVARIEAHLARTPEDGRGWEVLAPVYLKSGRAEDAVKAYAAALRLLGDAPQRYADYGEAMVVAAGGTVTADARTAFERALALDGTAPKPKFYLAVAAEQDGRRQDALALLADLARSGPADAPWQPVVRERMARLGGESGAAAVAALPPAERDAAIRGMVASLEARLTAEGGSVDGWLGLVRSYAVLGERGKARAALARAAERLAGDAEAERRLTAAARDLDLDITSDSGKEVSR